MLLVTEVEIQLGIKLFAFCLLFLQQWYRHSDAKLY